MARFYVVVEEGSKADQGLPTVACNGWVLVHFVVSKMRFIDTRFRSLTWFCLDYCSLLESEEENHEGRA